MQISIMVDPSLKKVKCDRQLFRMLLVNAILLAMNNITVKASSKARPVSSPTDGYETSAEGHAPPLTDTVNDVFEILVQVGMSVGAENGIASDCLRIENDVNRNFLRFHQSKKSSSCEHGSCIDRGGQAVAPRSPLHMMTIAVVDNGAPREQSSHGDGISDVIPPADKDHESVCRAIVEDCMQGAYENEILEPDQVFQNITRYSLPYVPVESVSGPLEDWSMVSAMWKAPSISGFYGFERPSRRYEYMRILYSKRGAPTGSGVATKPAADSFEDNLLWQRYMLMVHPDINVGGTHANTFAMHGWKCEIIPSLASILSHPLLHTVDMIIVCTSVFSAIPRSEVIPAWDDLKYLGYFGPLMCLADAAIPAGSSADTSAYETLDIPILSNSVTKVNLAADGALLNYIIGTNQHNAF